MSALRFWSFYFVRRWMAIGSIVALSVALVFLAGEELTGAISYNLWKSFSTNALPYGNEIDGSATLSTELENASRRAIFSSPYLSIACANHIVAADASAHAAELHVANECLEKLLAQSPLEPCGWARTAYVRHLRREASSDVIVALSTSLNIESWERACLPLDIWVAAQYWDVLPDRIRRVISARLFVLWDKDKNSVGDTYLVMSKTQRSVMLKIFSENKWQHDRFLKFLSDRGN